MRWENLGRALIALSVLIGLAVFAGVAFYVILTVAFWVGSLAPGGC